MITKAQALALRYGEIVHYTGKHECSRHIGPRGGVTENVTRARVSGKCKTWLSRPDDFRIPVKHGLYESGEITHLLAGDWHVEDECPLYHATQPPTSATVRELATAQERRRIAMADKALGVIYTIKIDPEDIPIEGNVQASGDDEADKKQEAWVREQLTSGNQAAWCCVEVTATVTVDGETFTGTDCIGGCSYENEDSLLDQLVPEMERIARNRLVESARAVFPRATAARKLITALK